MKNMKKALALLLAAAMTLSFASCGRNQTQPTADRTAVADRIETVSRQDEAADGRDETDLSREEKELVAELMGGQDGSGLTDAQLDELTRRLLNASDGDSADAGNTQKRMEVDTTRDPDAYDENGAMTKPFDEVYPELIEEEKVSFSGESILVKLAGGDLTDGLKAAGIGALDPIVPLDGAAWYEAKLTEGAEAQSALTAVRKLDEVLLAEYNYEVQVAALDDYKSFSEEQAARFSGNDRYEDQWYFHHCGMVDGYGRMNHPGGDSSVVVAVIDTGVDYDHKDLKDNMWVNTGEIPGNGIDDDGNGYVDDYYGVDILSGQGSGDDTNGHGTHVAGIIAARNNNVGVLGIAYNVKIMSVKAAAHNGTLNQADIAKAVLYAYENGAEVINMSFGGSACSIAVQDALATAYTRCVLVAAAGNDGVPNEPVEGWTGDVVPNYPAALSYVLGVMSVDRQGRESAFSNWDAEAYNGIEYELYAPGESVMSTLPHDQYGYLSGTSMAAPVVSAFAAILRSEFADRDRYPTKFIYGQLASTSGYRPNCIHPVLHNVPQIANLYDALTRLPEPELNVQDFAVFDDPQYGAQNNGDGVIDAGETIALGLTLRNRWGMSENTTVTIDTLSAAGDEDPYISITTPTVDFGGVGTYSTKDSGKIYTDGQLTGWENPFLLTVADNCPNDYRVTLNVTITCQNGLDETDHKTYTFKGKVNVAVRNGCVLPAIIEQDMVLTKDNLYIIPRATVIQSGVTVRVEPGTRIQFWSDDPRDPYAEEGIVFLRVEGRFLVNGTKEEPVYLYPSELKSNYVLDLGEANGGYISLRYADVTNLNKAANTSGTEGIHYAEHCTFRQNYNDGMNYRVVSGGKVKTYSTQWVELGTLIRAEKCVFYKLGYIDKHCSYAAALWGAADTCIFVDAAMSYGCSLQNCVFLGNALTNQTAPDNYGNSDLTLQQWSAPSVDSVVYNDATGTTYVLGAYNGDSTGIEALRAYIRQLGGDYVVFRSAEELEWVTSNLPMGGFDGEGTPYDPYDIGITYDWERERYVMADGSGLPDYLQQEGVTDGYHGDSLYLHGGKLYQNYRFTRMVLFAIPGKILPEEITFDRYRVAIDTETTLQLRPVSAPVPLSPADFLYESGDEAVLTVDSTGLVTPVARGTADVWVYFSDRAVKNHVTVEVGDYVPLESVSFPAAGIDVAVGETAVTDCTLTPADTTRRRLTYTVEDPTVAQVDEAGNVTGLASGSTVITAASAETGADGNPLTASMTVTVYQKTTSLTLADAAIAASVAEGAVPLPEAIGSDGADMTLTWRSSDEAVAIVEEGRLVPKWAGTTVLVATDTRSGLTATAFVVVTEQAASPIKDVVNSSGCWAVLLDDGRVYSWTSDASGRAPVLLAEDVLCIGANGSYGYVYMALTDGTVQDVYGGEPSCSTLTTQLRGYDIAKVAGAYDNYIAVTSDGGAYAWGKNSNGALGTGTTGRVDTPTKVMDGVADVAMTENASYFLTTDGLLFGAGKIGATLSVTLTLLDEGVKSILCTYYYGSYCIYSTTDGRLKKHDSGSVTTYPVDLSDMEQVAFSSGRGIGLRDGRVYTFVTGSASPQPMAGIRDARQVFSCGDTYYVATESGLLLGFGENTSNAIPGAPAGDVPTPTPILLEPVADEDVTLTDAALTDGVLTADTLTLTFNKAIVDARPRLYADGARVMADSAVVNTIGLSVSRSDGFAEGKRYELVFPAGSLTAWGGATNAEEIRLAFTYAPDKGTTDPTDVVYPSQRDESIQRILTAESLTADLVDYLTQTRYNPAFTGNAILNPLATDTDVSHWLRPTTATVSAYTEVPLGGNWWGTTNEELIGRQILDYADLPIYARLMYAPFLTQAPENTFPFVTGVTLLNQDGEEVTVVGNERVTFRITFNRDMDTTIPLLVRFGSAYPYGDYEVEGRYVDARTWEGSYTLNTLIENGDQFLSISNGCSATEDLELQMDRHRFRFEIDTTAAQSLIMQGTATDTGVLLKWTQDDFTTLMGYNVYRSTAEDGLYTRLNGTVIPADTMTWFDDTVEPGVVYYYNFTVVQTDLSESEPSGKITLMSRDTMAPNIYHSPVANAFTGANLVITATITDNLNVAYANLYYRVAGTEKWNIVRMNRLNDKFSAIIPAADVTLAGLEYYMEASDGVTATFKGSAEQPFTVLVQQAVGADELGDVNGDGVINNLDALLVLYAINDKYNMTAEEFARADLNGDGVLWAAEALRILQYVSGAVGSLKM